MMVPPAISQNQTRIGSVALALAALLQGLVLALMLFGLGPHLSEWPSLVIEAQLSIEQPPPEAAPPNPIASSIPHTTPPARPAQPKPMAVPPAARPTQAMPSARKTVEAAAESPPAPASAPSSPAASDPTSSSLPPPSPARLAAGARCNPPSYPVSSRRMGQTGTVRLAFLIGSDGQVLQSKIERSSGHDRLDEAARDALSLCRFSPAQVNGMAVESWARLDYVWRLE